MTNRNTVTLRELLNLVPDTSAERLPTAKALRDSEIRILFDVEIGTMRIVVYANGFYTYTDRGSTTVQSVYKCGEDVYYDEAAGHRLAYEAALFMDEPFQIRLALEGDQRLERNCRVRHSIHEYSYDNMPEESADLACKHDFTDDVIDKIGREELAVRVSELTDKQREAIELCYFQNMTQSDAAEYLGITREAVKARLAGGIAVLKKTYNLKEYIKN